MLSPEERDSTFNNIIQNLYQLHKHYLQTSKVQQNYSQSLLVMLIQESLQKLL